MVAKVLLVCSSLRWALDVASCQILRQLLARGLSSDVSMLILLASLLRRRFLTCPLILHSVELD